MTIYIEPSAYGTSDSSVVYQNLFADGTLTWSSQTPDGSAANALGPQTGDSWVPASMPAWLRVDMGVKAMADCAAIIAHNLGTSGATIFVECSANGSTWEVQSEIVPTDDADIFVLFDAGDDDGFRYWRIRVSGPVAPAIGIAWIGPRLFIPMGTQASYRPINLNADIQLSTSSTITGQYVASYIERKGGGTSISLAPQRNEWVKTDAAAFIRHYNEGRPFLWMSCPEDLPDDGHYCWRSGGVLSASVGTGTMWVDVSMEVNAYVA